MRHHQQQLQLQHHQQLQLLLHRQPHHLQPAGRAAGRAEKQVRPELPPVVGAQTRGGWAWEQVGE